MTDRMKGEAAAPEGRRHFAGGGRRIASSLAWAVGAVVVAAWLIWANSVPAAADRWSGSYTGIGYKEWRIHGDYKVDERSAIQKEFNVEYPKFNSANRNNITVEFNPEAFEDFDPDLPSAAFSLKSREIVIDAKRASITETDAGGITLIAGRNWRIGGAVIGIDGSFTPAMRGNLEWVGNYTENIIFCAHNGDSSKCDETKSFAGTVGGSTRFEVSNMIHARVRIGPLINESLLAYGFLGYARGEVSLPQMAIKHSADPRFADSIEGTEYGFGLEFVIGRPRFRLEATRDSDADLTGTEITTGVTFDF